MKAIGNGICISLSLLPLISSPFQSTKSGPNLLLAQTFKPESDVTEFWVSEKLDGVRTLWNGKELLTRGGYKVHAPDWFTSRLPEQALDGELWIARGEFEKVSSIIRRHDAPDDQWRDIKFMVFDLPHSLKDFNARLKELTFIVKEHQSEHLVLVEHFRVNHIDALYETLADVEKKGGEGLMLHRADSLYQARRTNDLQKLKSYQDAEAKVIAHIEGNGKYQGMMGAILVENKQGIRFKLGSGFSLQQRQTPPEIGSLVTYRYRGYTNHNTPRFATFLRSYQAH
ncbi:DNA ligase [Pleionea litopenaei]|uniref:DNA ligase n=1 Tax=Pleionea litopenaei TaxID=3070815 RepID=A0AA51RW22_9GAMM|nr:DNA ligase [Pleionea sp. HL-JVS1]WMS88498.1 DNA ligase [Pleionea sp. HL-JVS1]